MSLICCAESQHLEAPPGSDPTHNNIIGGESISINKLTYDEVASLKKKQRTLYIQISVLHGKWSIGVPTDFIKIKSIANQLSDLHLMLTSPIEANDEFHEAEKRFEHYNKNPTRRIRI